MRLPIEKRKWMKMLTSIVPLQPLTYASNSIRSHYILKRRQSIHIVYTQIRFKRVQICTICTYNVRLYIPHTLASSRFVFNSTTNMRSSCFSNKSASRVVIWNEFNRCALFALTIRRSFYGRTQLYSLQRTYIY